MKYFTYDKKSNACIRVSFITLWKNVYLQLILSWSSLQIKNKILNEGTNY